MRTTRGTPKLWMLTLAASGLGGYWLGRRGAAERDEAIEGMWASNTKLMEKLYFKDETESLLATLAGEMGAGPIMTLEEWSDSRCGVALGPDWVDDEGGEYICGLEAGHPGNHSGE